MFNPRFPHTLRVKRSVVEGGEPVVDENGNILYDYIPLTAVEMVDEEPVRDADGDFVTYEVGFINFGYRTASSNTRTAGDVVVADFKIACPMFLTELRYDDILEISDYDRTYTAKLVKKTTFNLGTNIWFNEIKN